MNIHRNLSLDDALEIAETLGCTVVAKRRHGEVLVHHWGVPEFHLVLNCRRKDAQMVLKTKLKQLQKR